MKFPHQDLQRQKQIFLLNRIEKLRKLTTKQRQRLSKLQSFRLVIGSVLLGVSLMIITKFTNPPIWMAFFLSLSIFSVLVRIHSRVKLFCEKIESLTQVYQQQIHKLKTNFLEIPDNSPTTLQLSEEQLILDKDLDILGDSSLYKLINDTFTDSGASLLYRKLFQFHTTHDEIKTTGQRIEKLAKFPGVVDSILAQAQRTRAQLHLKEFKEKLIQSFVGEKFKIACLVTAIVYPIYLFVMALSFEHQISVHPILPYSAYFLFSLWGLKQTAQALKKSESLSVHSMNLGQIFKKIETKPIALDDVCPTICQVQPAKNLKKISTYIAFMSIESHWLIYLVVNSIIPWNLFFTFFAEKWRKKYNEQILSCCDEMNGLEVIISFTQVYRFQTQTFALAVENSRLKCQGIYHPLVPRDKVVANDFAMENDNRLILITGSNMSGKSTFLRTIALNIRLASVGCPVFATSFDYPKGEIITCLRVSDSIEQGYSSFYYEVKRLAKILESSKQNKQLIYFVDEIFKGTNNRERFIGAKALIEEFVKYPNAIGFITTHDLDLPQLADVSTSISNYHFKDDIKDSGLHFSYKIHPGPCPSVNALKIMALEGLPVPS